jgi:hypothetical protein
VAGEDVHFVEAFVFQKYQTGISDLMKPRLKQAPAIILAKSSDELVAALRKDAYSFTRHRFFRHDVSVVLVTQERRVMDVHRDFVCAGQSEQFIFVTSVLESNPMFILDRIALGPRSKKKRRPGPRWSERW